MIIIYCGKLAFVKLDYFYNENKFKKKFKSDFDRQKILEMQSFNDKNSVQKTGLH